MPGGYKLAGHHPINTKEHGEAPAKTEDAQMKSILDPTFRYRNSAETDLRATFARVRREQAKAKEAAAAKVQPIIVRDIRKAAAK